MKYNLPKTSTGVKTISLGDEEDEFYSSIDPRFIILDCKKYTIEIFADRIQIYNRQHDIIKEIFEYEEIPFVDDEKKVVSQIKAFNAAGNQQWDNFKVNDPLKFLKVVGINKRKTSIVLFLNNGYCVCITKESISFYNEGLVCIRSCLFSDIPDIILSKPKRKTSSVSITSTSSTTTSNNTPPRFPTEKKFKILLENNKDLLNSKPHPNKYFAAQGKTLYDYYSFSSSHLRSSSSWDRWEGKITEELSALGGNLNE